MKRNCYPMAILQFGRNSLRPSRLLGGAGRRVETRENDNMQVILERGHVTSQEQEPALHTNSPVSIIPGINLGATAATRYVLNGSAYVYPFDVLSISNFSNPSSISGTATLVDGDGNTVARAPIPAIPPNGAAGFLVMGRFAGDPGGLFPSTLVLPARSDGIFHGNLVVSMTGLTATGMNIVLSQEFNGNSLLNLFVFHSSIP